MLSKLLTDLVLVCFAVREMSIPQLCCVVFVFNPKGSDKSQRGKECKGAQESAGGGGGGGWGGGWGGGVYDVCTTMQPLPICVGVTVTFKP